MRTFRACDALADPDLLLGPELVELARGDGFVGEERFFPFLIRGEVAGEGKEAAAVELEDARAGAVEEGAVVGDHDRGLLREQAFEDQDAVQVEVVGRLVEEQQVRLPGEGPGERRALCLTAGQMRWAPAPD